VVRPDRDEQEEETAVRIDCEQCQIRGAGCGQCVINLLLGGRPHAEDEDSDGLPDGLTAEERRAVAVLVRSGLVDPQALRPGDRSGERTPAVTVPLRAVV
jgi:hypothetical protein